MKQVFLHNNTRINYTWCFENIRLKIFSSKKLFKKRQKQTDRQKGKEENCAHFQYF